MHPVVVLAAFAVAALGTYALTLAALSATSTLVLESRDEVPQDPRHDHAAAPNPATGMPLPPWVPANGGHVLLENDPADVPAPGRRPHAHC